MLIEASWLPYELGIPITSILQIRKLHIKKKKLFVQGVRAGVQPELPVARLVNWHLESHSPRVNGWGGEQGRFQSPILEDSDMESLGCSPGNLHTLGWFWALLGLCLFPLLTFNVGLDERSLCDLPLLGPLLRPCHPLSSGRPASGRRQDIGRVWLHQPDSTASGPRHCGASLQGR